MPPVVKDCREKRRFFKDRAEWDPLHPGVLASKIRPAYITQDGQYLVEIRTGLDGEADEIETRVKGRSKAMRNADCDGCSTYHKVNNTTCSANRPDPSVPPFLETVPQLNFDVFQFWSLTPDPATGERVAFPGYWQINRDKSTLDPERHTSADIIFERTGI